MAATPGTKTRQPASKKASGPGRGRGGASTPTGRAGRTPARPGATAARPGKPQARQRPALAVVGHLLAQLWRALSATAGTLARAIGRNAATARDLDPAHRRDGAGLALQGRPVGPVRLPMVDATEHELSHLREDLAAAGLG